MIWNEIHRLADLGFSVVPAAVATKRPTGEIVCSCGKTRCPSPGKHPLPPWAAYQSTRPTKADLKSWQVRFPVCNVSVVTGAVSGLVVVDIDPARGGDESIASLPPLPDTVTVITGGGGTHLYFRHPGTGEIPNRAGWRPGVDIRADGGQVIAPPSVHASGRAYEWEVGRDPWTFEIADMPGWLVEELAGAGTPGVVREPFRLEEALEQPIPEGERNVRMTQIIGALVTQYRDRPWELPGICQSVNERLCNPPLPRDEIMGILASIWRRDLARWMVERVTLPIATSAQMADAMVDDDGMDAEQLTPEQRRAATIALWNTAGIKHVEVHRTVALEVRDRVEWFAVLSNDSKLFLGDDIGNYNAISSAFLNWTGDVLLPFKRHEWLAIASRIQALAERSLAMETGPDAVDQWVAMMAQQRAPFRVPDGADDATRIQAARALMDGVVVLAPVHGETHTWVSLPKLVTWLDLTMAERVSARVLAGWMKTAGWENAQFPAGGKTFRAWRKRWDCGA